MRSRRDFGQALIESLIGLALLGPLFLGVWYIGSLQNLTLETLNGARQGFLSVYATDRVDSLPDLEKLISDEKPAGGMLQYRSEFTISSDVDLPRLAAAQEASDALLAPIKAMTSDEFSIGNFAPRRINASVQIEPAEWSGVSSLVPRLRIDATFALVVGSANSSSRSETLHHLSGLSLSSRFQALALPVSVLRPALEIIEPAFERFCPGLLDPDIVPADRLSTSVGPANDLRKRSC